MIIQSVFNSKNITNHDQLEYVPPIIKIKIINPNCFLLSHTLSFDLNFNHYLYKSTCFIFVPHYYWGRGSGFFDLFL